MDPPSGNSRTQKWHAAGDFHHFDSGCMKGKPMQNTCLAIEATSALWPLAIRGPIPTLKRFSYHLPGLVFSTPNIWLRSMGQE